MADSTSPLLLAIALARVTSHIGFIIGSQLVPGGLDPFVDKVVPLLQERGVFRAEYEGATLREHLGLVPLGAAKAAPVAS
jgi:alkanesulfonate monooxygenase SsuD/methylene tetrahydromethanopterin reductase-like flavin-dependent oxidoreductase (luciferase family)